MVAQVVPQSKKKQRVLVLVVDPAAVNSWPTEADLEDMLERAYEFADEMMTMGSGSVWRFTPKV